MTAEGESECICTLHSFNTLWSSDGSGNPRVPEVLWDDWYAALSHLQTQQSSSRHTRARNESSKKRSGRGQGTVFLRWVKHKGWFRGVLLGQVPSTSHSHSLISLGVLGCPFYIEHMNKSQQKNPSKTKYKKTWEWESWWSWLLGWPWMDSIFFF